MELLRIQRAVAKKQKLEEESKSRIKVHAENVKRLEALMAKYDPEVEMKEPYWSREDLDEAEKLRNALLSAPKFQACCSENLMYANQEISTAISLGWQSLPLLKQVAILDTRVKGLEEQLARPFDARVKGQLDEVNKLQGEKKRFEELRWTQIQKISVMLGCYDVHDFQLLNKELTEKGPEAVRQELIEKLKEHGQKPRPQKQEEEE